MGWLRKTARRVGREMRRAVTNVGKLMGEIAKPLKGMTFAILGTVALSMIMPWTISSVFNGLTSPTGWFARTAGSLGADKSLAQRAVGYLMTGIHKGATSLRNGYNTAKTFITDKIHEGLDWLSDKKTKFKNFNIEEPLDETIPDYSDVVEEEYIAKDILKEPESLLRENLQDYILDKADKHLDFTRTANMDAYDDLGKTIGYQGFDFIRNRAPTGRASDLDLKLKDTGFYYGGPSYMADIENSTFGRSAYYKHFDEVDTVFPVDRILSEN